jgi:glycosyltransferase involved in cell wall biosynthesis
MPAGVQRHAVFSEHDVCGGPDDLSAGPFTPLLSKVEARRWASFNRKVWRSASAVLVPTREDAAVLLSRAPGVPVEVVPYGLVRPGLCEGSSEGRSGDTLLFVGNFDHPPNREAALLLARTIFPNVQRSVPHAGLVLVGKNPTAEIEALASRSSGITVTGEVESVGPYLQGCALFVAPLVSGGGARMKLIEAMMAGAPIITTPLGARGLEAQPGKHILVADPGDDFAQMVVSALRDPHLRERLGTAARNLYCTRDRTEERAQRLNALLVRYAR